MDGWMDGSKIQSQLLMRIKRVLRLEIEIMSDTKDEEKDRNKDQRSLESCKTPKIQELTVRYRYIMTHDT
jgi:hypothetical protein